MILNTDKTVVMNTCLNYRQSYDDDLPVVEGAMVSPSPCTKFLGVSIDNKLSFNAHVDAIVSKCNARLFLMRKLKANGLNNEGLRTFYRSNIRSLICYAIPAWYTFLSDLNKTRLERLQRSATRIIFSDFDYEARLSLLNIPLLNDFILTCHTLTFAKSWKTTDTLFTID